MRALYALAVVPAFGLLAYGCGFAQAQPGGMNYESGKCTVAPRIDGVFTLGEWQGAIKNQFDLPMVALKGGQKPSRKVSLSLMNSATNLYVAFSIPDDARDFNLNPPLADLALLAFCKGPTLTTGDDRRVLLPGAYADKHVTEPGKDADDTQKDGNGVMAWRKTETGGEYFIEWQVPLNSKDPNDIAAKPGDKLKFNLVYMDRFSFTFDQTEAGGLFGADANNAAKWGMIELAANVAQEAPAPAPKWLASLVPNTDAPDHLAKRLRRLEAEEIDVAGKLGGRVTVELTFPAVSGKPETAKARIFLPPALRDDPNKRVPLIHNAGYELDENGAKALLARGFAVSTTHAHPLNPLGRGVNLDRAIMHAVRTLPFIDAGRVSIQGGSAGGWMTLMLTADAFPLVWSAPGVPPLHWGYNAAYIGEQKKLAEPPAGSQVSPLPVFRQVIGIADQANATYGMPFDSETYLATSPLAHAETITAPTQMTYSTADMLVPINQLGREYVKPIDAATFPKGFSLAMTDRFPGVEGKRTLLSALSPQRYEVFVLRTPPDLVTLGAAAPATPAKPVALPFSKEKVWSVVVLDEGAPEPAVGHFKYAWPLDDSAFKQWAEERGVVPEQLTALKLERLMKRVLGEEWRPFKVRPNGQGEPIPGTQLDWPEAERHDVAVGLKAFALNDACAVRLGRLYEALPSKLKVYGKGLGDGTAAGVRSALDAATK